MTSLAGMATVGVVCTDVRQSQISADAIGLFDTDVVNGHRIADRCDRLETQEVLVPAVPCAQLVHEDGVPAGQWSGSLGRRGWAAVPRRALRHRDRRDADVRRVQHPVGELMGHGNRLNVRMTIQPTLQQQQVLPPVDVAVQQPEETWATRNACDG